MKNNNESSVDNAVAQGKIQGVVCGDGLGADAPMSLERKCLVLVGAACIMLTIVCAVGIGFAIHPVAGLFALMLCAAWIGEAVVSTLKKNREDSSPNSRVRHGLSEAKDVVCNRMVLLPLSLTPEQQ